MGKLKITNINICLLKNTVLNAKKKGVKMLINDPKWSNMVRHSPQTCPKWWQMVANGTKWYKIVQCGPKWSKMVKKGPK